MKRIIPFLLLFFFCTGLAAGQIDSTLYEELDKVKKEIMDLNAKVKRLNAADYMIQKDQKSALEELDTQLSGLKGAIDQAGQKTASLDQSLSAHQQDSSDRIDNMEAWSKQMMTILGMVSLLLFILLIILVFTNRKRIRKDYLKLEAKVDNTKDAIEKEIRELEKKHEKDLAELRETLEKGKK
ncbi:MAG: hypothetical protein AMS26_18190 [Bacteroides sp. SM23_62]|nr:MAG: hypothetical protein AMS26_18190 [Bacteroides sp. SM23_62]